MSVHSAPTTRRQILNHLYKVIYAQNALEEGDLSQVAFLQQNHMYLDKLKRNTRSWRKKVGKKLIIIPRGVAKIADSLANTQST